MKNPAHAGLFFCGQNIKRNIFAVFIIFIDRALLIKNNYVLLEISLEVKDLLNKKRLPFTYTKQDNFFDKLGEWVGDVFYDILPEKGFELRDEQVFMAYQVERAFRQKEVMFAEAGVGTGKTIVYLLYAISYARHTGKPAIISCADESLIEQLVKPEGDISKLSKALDLDIDVRLAKSEQQYLCLKKLDETMASGSTEQITDVFHSLPDFVHDTQTMQSFAPYGDRKQYPGLTDEEWNKVSFDDFQECSVCPKRHRCGLTLSRDHYRKAADLIICSHDFYMAHVWTKESRKRKGQIPYLPESSCVIFDEGHLVELAAQKALTYRIKESTLEQMLTRLLENDIREEFAVLVEKAIEDSERFFTLLKGNSEYVEGSDRKRIHFSSEFLHQTRTLVQTLQQIGNELVFESEMYAMDQYQLKVVDEQLDMFDYSLNLLLSDEKVIAWSLEEKQETTIVIMPRLVKDVLKERVFTDKRPYVFTSATLSENGSFHYMADTLGIDSFESFSVESPFDYDEQMTISVLQTDEVDEKAQMVTDAINETDGGVLILLNSKDELRSLQHYLEKSEVKKDILFEGQQEISELISVFQNKANTVLCSYSLWEGLDVPGPSLSTVVIWSLPFPPNDPVFEARRKYSDNPYEDIDIPYMLLRLRQGVGRLIRTSEDRGDIYLFKGKDNVGQDVWKQVEAALPVKPKYEC